MNSETTAASVGTATTLVQESPWRWRIDAHGEMRVPGILFSSPELLPKLTADRSLDQVTNVATLPGIVEASYAMPDVHWGYGFPIGGVAATDVSHNGVVSPGGVGFDISCGVRMLLSEFHTDEMQPHLASLMDELDKRIPRGLGRRALWNLRGEKQLHSVLERGAQYAVECGYGNPADIERCEDHGMLEEADVTTVSQRALDRGLGQVGSLGSGNHFLEIQRVETIFDPAIADAFGLWIGQVCVMIHCGSRGLGHQICSDHVRIMLDAMPRHGIRVPDPQLACVPATSNEGKQYLHAMAAAANYGRANRQLLSVATRQAFETTTGQGKLTLLYDVSHNLAKIEQHDVNGQSRLLCVHRKGATLALPPGHPDLSPDLTSTGQPVLVPGSMGTSSYVMVGVEGSGAFNSTCHGAGRTMSRHAALKKITGRRLRQQLSEGGIMVRSHSDRGLAEEAPFSYKDVDAVVTTCEHAGLAHRVARLRPIGVVKA